MTISYFKRGDHELAYIKKPTTQRSSTRLGVLFCSGLITPMAG